MTIERKTVRQISRLARISLDESEIDHFGNDLGRILDWVQQLEAVDTESVAPFSDMGGELLSRARDDVAEPAPPRDDLLANAPESSEGFFTVPKILE